MPDGVIRWVPVVFRPFVVDFCSSVANIKPDLMDEVFEHPGVWLVVAEAQLIAQELLGSVVARSRYPFTGRKLGNIPRYHAWFRPEGLFMVFEVGEVGGHVLYEESLSGLASSLGFDSCTEEAVLLESQGTPAAMVSRLSEYKRPKVL